MMSESCYGIKEVQGPLLILTLPQLRIHCNKENVGLSSNKRGVGGGGWEETKKQPKKKNNQKRKQKMEDYLAVHKLTEDEIAG